MSLLPEHAHSMIDKMPGLGTDAARERYRELTVQQEQLRRQAVAEIAQRSS